MSENGLLQLPTINFIWKPRLKLIVGSCWPVHYRQLTCGLLSVKAWLFHYRQLTFVVLSISCLQIVTYRCCTQCGADPRYVHKVLLCLRSGNNKPKHAQTTKTIPNCGTMETYQATAAKPGPSTTEGPPQAGANPAPKCRQQTSIA